MDDLDEPDALRPITRWNLLLLEQDVIVAVAQLIATVAQNLIDRQITAQLLWLIDKKTRRRAEY